MKNITDALNWRYTTKVFDTDKKISEEDFSEIEQILQMAPTSTNLQPNHFIIANDEAGKDRIAKAATGFYNFNNSKIKGASHVIVFASKVLVDEKHLELVLEKESQDGRFTQESQKIQQGAGRRTFLNIHRFDLRDEGHWHAKQSYLVAGAVLLGAAELGIDATPIEGVDLQILNKEFDLESQNLSANLVIALGYHKEDEDFNAKLPKSRLDKTTIITMA
ncbi:MAG TPA: oxygen-insensitive NAD(P)H nitroreductase [Lactovum miscens]|uniref:oxygen-insensitive NAD(P)H nitroreductase n=1 Tax=Lactovum miscens TaxID=190387 RepID=UPI002EDA7459